MLTMKSLHRPVHEKLIFSSDWAKMSESEQKKALSEGKLRLPSPRELRNLNSKQIAEIREQFKPMIDEIKDGVPKVLKSFPKGLLFITRY